MKSSIFNFGCFVFLTCLTVLLPAYVLMTGSASLMPLVLAGVVVAAVPTIWGMTCTCILVFMAEKKSSTEAHASLKRVYAVLSAIRPWRTWFTVSRYVAQAVLLLALAEPLAAGFVIAGIVAYFIGIGVTESYIARVTPFKVQGDRTYINSALVIDGSVQHWKLRKKRTGFGGS